MTNFDPSDPRSFLVDDGRTFVPAMFPVESGLPPLRWAERIELGPEDWERFLALLDDDSPPPQALVDLMRGKP